MTGTTDATTGPTLRPLRWLFWGLLLVVLDLRVEDIDLVPDPLGWLAGLVAVGGLARWHRGFALATVGCALGLLTSLPDWVDPDLTWVQPVVTVAQTAVVFGTCTALMALRPEARRRADLLRWWDLALSLLVVPAVLVARLGLDAARPPLGAPLLVLLVLLAVAAVVVFVLFLVLVIQVSRDGGEFTPAPA